MSDATSAITGSVTGAPLYRWSLRARLLLFFLVASAVGWLGSAALVLSAAERESAQQGDEALHRSGELLMAMAQHEYLESGGQLDALQSQLRIDFHDYLFQVFGNDGRLLLRSQDAPSQPMSVSANGFADADVAGLRYRVARLHSELPPVEVLIAESTSHRHRGSRRLAVALVAPVLIGLPLLALVAQLFSQRALRPLRQAAQRLAEREPGDLAPIEPEGFPREAEPLVSAFNGLLQRLARLVDDQRHFASTVAHELRTPLAAVKLDLQRLDSGEHPVADTLPRVLDTLARASAVIEQLLVLARIESSRAAATSGGLDLARVVEEILRQFASRIGERGLTVETALAPMPLHGFEHPLYIVLRNLVENAVRHASPGGRLRLSAAPRPQGGWRLTVEDDGAGMDGDAMHGALGLGLTIVERIVQALGGRLLRTRSELLGGACLAVEIDALPGEVR